jgi:PAS domain-containing protein
VNDNDRERLIRISLILEAIPFSASGMATTTGIGAVMFEQDMRALRPYIRKVFEGMILEGNPNFEEGLDYDNPYHLIVGIEKWIQKRKDDGWQNASQYSLEYFLKHEGIEIL